MALNLVSPGVKVREVDLTIGRVDAINDQVGAIAGPFEKGPVNEPVLIETEQDLLRVFGKPKTADDQNEYWLSASNYLSYGGTLRVIRVGAAEGSSAFKNANAGISSAFSDLRIESFSSYNQNEATYAGWYYAAKNPGSWANNLKVCVIDNFADQIISGISTSAAFVSGFTTAVTKSSVTIGINTTILTGVTTSSIALGQSLKPINGIVGSGITVVGISTLNSGTITLASQTSNLVSVVVDLDFGTVTSTQTGLSLQVGYGVTQTLNKNVADGSSVETYDGFLRGIVTGIGNSEVYVKITDRVDSAGVSHPVDYKNPGNANENLNAFSFDTLRTLNLNFSTSAGAAVTSVLADSITDWYDSQTLGLTNSTVYWKTIAPKPGTSQYASERNAKNDELHIVVVDDTGSVTGIAGNVIEKFTNLSKATDGRISPSQSVYYKEYIANNSEYIYTGVAQTGFSAGLTAVSGSTTSFTATNYPWGTVAQGSNFNVIGAKSYNLLGGKDYSGTNNVGGYSVTNSSIIYSYELLNNPSEYSLNFIICGPSGGASIYESQAKANALITIAEARKDCIACISPHKAGIVNLANSTTQTNNIVDFFEPLASSSYAVFDGNYKYMFDRFNNKFVYIGCNSDVAGLMAKTGIDNYSWFSPAGASRGVLNNAVKLAYNPNQSQRDSLYTRRVNPIIAYPGSGFILFGDKTGLSYASAFDRINVRRLFLTLEATIERAARAQLFEFNDTITRNNFVNIVEPYLRDVKSKRGITDFLVVCDESNNTPDVIDANQFKADIFIKPARTINFVGLTFVATRTGVSFSEITGTV